MSRQFPVVLLSGPRQSGKTSLLQHSFPDAEYVSLDDPSLASAAESNPKAFLRGLRKPVVIDEIQYAPTLFRHIKLEVDANPRPGSFLLTGSQSFALMHGVSESLAGRCGVMSLHSLSYEEIQPWSPTLSESEFMFAGGFPALHARTEIDPGLWYPSYVATYLERDIRNLLNVQRLGDFNRFLRASVLRTGQVLSFSDLARDVGIAPNTARTWLSLLHTSGSLFLIESYHSNLGKRLIKSPKVIAGDTGLACNLAGLHDPADLDRYASIGSMWETFVAGQVMRFFAFRGLQPPLYYWRTSSGQEMDLLIEGSAGRLIAVECKWKEHPTTRDAAGFEALRRFYGKERILGQMIVCRTSADYRLTDGVEVVSVSSLVKKLDRLTSRSSRRPARPRPQSRGVKVERD